MKILLKLFFVIILFIGTSALCSDEIQLMFSKSGAGEIRLLCDGSEQACIMSPRISPEQGQSAYPVDYMREIEWIDNHVVYKGRIANNVNVLLTFKKETSSKARLICQFTPEKDIRANELAIPLKIPLSFMQSRGWWEASNGKKGRFLYEISQKPRFSGNVSWLKLSDNTGKILCIKVFGADDKIVLLDNRRFNWQVFECQIKRPVPEKVLVAGKTYSFAISFEAIKAETEIGNIVDKFGQYKLLSWPGKIQTIDELQNDVKRENEILGQDGQNKDTALEFDQFGGSAGSSKEYKLKSTLFFRIEKVNGKWWLIDPEGNLFFSIGVCSLTTWSTYTRVERRRNLFEWIPAADDSVFYPAVVTADDGQSVSFYITNLIRKYGAGSYQKLWKNSAKKRFRHWGFNTVSAFGDKLERFPYVEWRIRNAVVDAGQPIPGTFYMGSTAIPDVYSEDFKKNLDANIRKMVEPLKDDSWLVGYFLGNEEKWGSLGRIVINLSEDWAVKRELVSFLKSEHSSYEEFIKHWNIQGGSWNELAQSNLIAVDDIARQQLNQFVENFVGKYYQLVTESIRKYDPNHLILGSRLLPTSLDNSPGLMATASRYLDVVSINYYADKVDIAKLRQYYAVVNKPIILSEYSYGACDRGHTGGPRTVANQKSRGMAYQDYVSKTAALDFIVGCHWFEYCDQPLTGRRNDGTWGERYNVGLVNVVDRPYEELIKAAKKVNRSIYKIRK